MNTTSFYQNVDEGNKSLNAMSPDPLLSEAFGKGSGCATLVWHNENTVLLEGSGASTPADILHITVLELEIKQITARTERELCFSFSLKFHYISHFVHYFEHANSKKCIRIFLGQPS